MVCLTLYSIGPKIMAPGLCSQSNDTCFFPSRSVVSGWKRGSDPWPRDHESYDIRVQSSARFEVLLLLMHSRILCINISMNCVTLSQRNANALLFFCSHKTKSFPVVCIWLPWPWLTISSLSFVWSWVWWWASFRIILRMLTVNLLLITSRQVKLDSITK